MKKIFYLLLCFSAASANADISNHLNIRTIDGTVSNYPYQIQCTNGSLVDNGNGTMTLFDVAVSTNNHIVTSGSTPTMGTCGSSPSVIGDDNHGIITVGGGVVTACTMNFSQTWGSACNVICNESDNSTAVTGDISALSPTAITFSFSATLGGGLIYYQCSGFGTGCR
jgi:hypothetical protein